MAIRNLFAQSLVLLVFCTLATLVSGQFWRRQNGYTYTYPQRYPHQQFPYMNYNQQRPNQQSLDFQIPPGIPVSAAEWVCKNPKTGDMMIIAAQDGQVPNTGGSQQWQQPSFPQPQPPITKQPVYPQTEPNYSESTANLPENLTPSNQPPHTQIIPNEQPALKPEEPHQEPPNTNGEGQIDIRLGKI